MQTVVDFSCIAHVEHADQDHVATEVGEAEEVHQEEEQQQFEGEDQEQNQELTNFVDTQGKHRFIYPNILHRFKFMQAPVHLSHLSLNLCKPRFIYPI